MFEKGLKLCVKGEPFDMDDYTEFSILKKNPNNKKQSTIIYGRNGAGKTSISKSLYELKTDIDSRHFNVLLKNEDNMLITDFNASENLYVFNEVFIDKQVKFKENGLETIVLLGDGVVSQNMIDDLNNTINSIDTDLKKIDLSIYEDKKNTDNPIFYVERMQNTLKREGNWQTRQQVILKRKTKPPVNLDVIEDINKNKQKISIDDFNRLLENYLNSNEKEKINFVFKYLLNNFNQENIIKILEKKLDVIKNDEIAIRILETIERHNDSRTKEIIETFNEDINYCPYCFREIKSSERKELVKKIGSVLSNESEEFLYEIEKLKLPIITPEVVPSCINENLKNDYYKKLENYNLVVRRINDILENKKLNLYVSLEYPTDIKYDDIFNELNYCIQELNNKIDEYNVFVENYKEIKNNLQKYNNYLSWQTIKDDYKIYKDKLEEKKKYELECKRLIDIKSEKQKQLKKLIEAKHNIRDACNEINKILSVIFYDKERLTIVPDSSNEYYIVKSNGKAVEMDKLSTGERNVIALCYFFSSIGKGKHISSRYDDEYMIVIDDPISSFDHNNKVGIYSFLRSNVKKFKASHFVVLTHSYEVAYNTAKIFNDVYGSSSAKNPKHITNYMEISNLKVIRPQIDLNSGKNQYKKLLNEVFKYANCKDSEITALTIGNSLRRILEMFSTFEYSTGFEKVIEKIEDNSNFESVLKDYMFRILLNNESHGMLAAYAFDDIEQFDMFDENEKIRTAKLSLILLNLLNNKHLEAHLGIDNIRIINQWKQEVEDKIQEVER